VQDRIRALSNGDAGPGGSAQRRAVNPAASPASRTDDNGERDWSETPGTGDRRFANYLASSFEARQPLNAEPGTRRNKSIFIAAVAVLAFVAWVLTMLL